MTARRTLILFDEFANNLSLATAGGWWNFRNSRERKKTLESTKFLPVIAEDRAGKMVEIDAKAVLTIPRSDKS